MEPIYRSDGEWVAVYYQGHLFNVDGEWLGFLVGREVHDPTGRYIGFLSDDRRFLRKRSEPRGKARRKPPQRPQRPQIPASMPLAPMMAALPYSLIDMFEEFGETLMYVSETRPDME